MDWKEMNEEQRAEFMTGLMQKQSENDILLATMKEEKEKTAEEMKQLRNANTTLISKMIVTNTSDVKTNNKPKETDWESLQKKTAKMIALKAIDKTKEAMEIEQQIQQELKDFKEQ